MVQITLTIVKIYIDEIQRKINTEREREGEMKGIEKNLKRNQRMKKK